MASVAQASKINLRPISAVMGCEITGPDLSQPLDESTLAAVRKAFHDHQVVVFRNQKLEPEQQVAFAACFGRVHVHPYTQSPVFMVSNVDDQGKTTGKPPNVNAMVWHSDASWQDKPALTTLYGIEVPRERGETEFSSMYAAYDNLSPEMKAKLEPLRAVHGLEYSQRRWGGGYEFSELTRKQVAEHPVVITHPATGRKAIYLGAHASHIASMPEAEGRRLVDEVNDLITRPELGMRHRWQAGDLIMWDNRCTLHRGSEFDYTLPRILRRVSIVGDIRD